MPSSGVHADRVMARLVEVVQETMQPEHVSLWLRQDGRTKRRAMLKQGSGNESG